MSDLSEQVDEAIEKTMSHELSEGEERRFVQITEEYAERVPGMTGAVEHFHVAVLMAVQRAYRWFAGSKEFESPTEALERTQAEMFKQLVPVLIGAFSDGVQMGQEQSFCYKKYRMFKKLDEVFNSKAWQAESDLIGMPFQADFDSVRVFERLLEMTVLQLGAGSGYHGFTGERINKIWDLWMLTAHSTCIGCYQSGVRLGKQWSEENALAGIMAATDASGES